MGNSQQMLIRVLFTSCCTGAQMFDRHSRGPYYPAILACAPDFTESARGYIRNVNQWMKHPQQRSSMFSLHQRVCVCVSMYLLAANPVGLADSLRGHMADRNYTLCASLSGEYLSASVCSFHIWNSQCLFCFTLCVGVDTIVHIARGQCTARWRLFELHNYRAIHVICRPTWLGGRATESTGGSWFYELLRSSRLFVVVKWLQVLHCNAHVLCRHTHPSFFGGGNRLKNLIQRAETAGKWLC